MASTVDIDEYGLWLVKCPDQVFPFRYIDTGLAAYRTVHLGQKGRGNLHKGDAAHVGGCQKAGNIAGYSAAQGNKTVFAIKTCPGKSACQFTDCLQRLIHLTMREGEYITAESRPVQAKLALG